MNKPLPLAILISLVVITSINGQEKRNYTFNKQIIEYYMFSNMTPSFTRFPNHKAKFIVVNTDNDLYEYSISNKNENLKEARKDKALYYYLKLPQLKDEQKYLEFFEKFIKENYRKDFFDRNTVSLEFSNGKALFNCESLDYLNTFLSKVIVEENSKLLQCNKALVMSNKREQTDLKTSIEYGQTTFIESEQKRKYFEILSQVKNWNKTFFLDISLGQNFIDSAYKTSFDEETLVDISETKSIWQFNIGYMFSNKLGGLLDFGFMSAKEQDIDFTTFSGTASGFAVLKLGYGIRYIPFAKKNWSIYSDLKRGTLNVKAAGGSGGIGVSNVTETSETNNYFGVSIGAIHRLGKVVFLKSNFEYTNSNFKNNIGSISGFTGYTINLGIGFSF